MTDLDRVLRDFVQVFDAQGVPYAVMGGIAVRAHGIPRPTYDVDFTLAIDRARLPELYHALSRLGYTVSDQYLRGWVDRVADMPVVKARLYLQGRGIDADLFLAESPFQEQIIARRRREQVDDFVLWIVSPEDLILLKLLANRPRDLADVGDILFMQGELDEAYLRHWAKELAVLDELDRQLRGR